MTPGQVAKLEPGKAKVQTSDGEGWVYMGMLERRVILARLVSKGCSCELQTRATWPEYLGSFPRSDEEIAGHIARRIYDAWPGVNQDYIEAQVFRAIREAKGES